MNRIAMVLCMLVASATFGAEVELFVTDYGENPTAEQRPLIDQPLVFAKPQEATIKTAEGKTVAFQSPASVSVRKGTAGNPREARLFAAVGEYEPFSFLLRPAEALAQVSITAGDRQAIRARHGSLRPSANTSRSASCYVRRRLWQTSSSLPAR